MNNTPALFVTPVVPADLRVRGSGILRRFALLVQGVSRLASSIDFVIQTDAWRAAELERYTQESREMLARLTALPVSVNLIPIDPPSSSSHVVRDYLAASLNLCRLPGFRPYLGPSQLAALRAALDRQPSFVLAHRLVCAAQLLRLSRQRRLPPVFFDLDDIEHITYRRNLEQPPHWRSKRLGYLHLPALIAGERAAVRLATRTFVCSDLDRRKLWWWFRNVRVMTLPNAVDIPAETPLPTAPRLLFLGIYGYRPNSAAAEYLIDEIWPRIRAEIANAELVLAGAKPEAIRHSQAPPPGVHFPGYVPDLDRLYANTRVVVCPLRTGGGTRVKILEAAAYGRPIVSTPVGAEGLDLRDGRDILLRADPESFAQACIELLRDHTAAIRLGRSARQLVATTYDRDTAVARLGTMIQTALRETAPT